MTVPPSPVQWAKFEYLLQFRKGGQNISIERLFPIAFLQKIAVNKGLHTFSEFGPPPHRLPTTIFFLHNLQVAVKFMMLRFCRLNMP